MLLFRPPLLTDRDAAAKAVAESGYNGSDAGFANVYLLRKKYGTLIALQEGFLFRYYNGEGSRQGYAFPLSAGAPSKALELIVEDSRESGRPLEFCLVDEPRAQILREYFSKILDSECAEPALHFENNRGDSDYIYSAESLATLPGSYEQFELREMTPANIADALEIEKRWLNDDGETALENTDCETPCDCAEAALAERSEDEKSRMAEYCAIVEALENFDALGMKGSVLYVEGKPVGMTIASEIAPGVWDIHFEKVIGEYADNGGYAVINKLFAEHLVAAGATLINREEDIGLEGLRKAKLSYYPQTILDKTHVTCQSRDSHSQSRDSLCHPREGGDLPD